MDEARPRHFDPKNWDPNFRAELYQAEFYATTAWAAERESMVAAWNGSSTAEIKKLRALRDRERPAHTGEIIRELLVPVVIGYWYELLRISPQSHRLTDELLYATIYLAGSVATYFKKRFNRARPWVLAPDLLPPVQLLPGLPAYPGGHSAQAHLMAQVLAYLVPAKTQQINQVADNVAANRERGGLNYPSDTEAGKQLARRVFGILTQECALFQATLKHAAAKEWNPALDPHRDILERTGLPT